MFSTESALQNSPLVLGFTPPVLAKLATYTSMLQYATDQAIITEGQPSENLFVLVKGQIVVEKVGSQGQRVLIAEVDQPGSFFGELALVDIQAHSATVRCSVASVFVVLPKAHLVDFFAEFPQAQMTMILNILRVISQRMRMANDRVVELAQLPAF